MGVPAAVKKMCIFSPQISSAACGYGFTLLSSNTKDVTKVWGMGLNKDSQLGFQRTQRDRRKSPPTTPQPSSAGKKSHNPGLFISAVMQVVTSTNFLTFCDFERSY